MNARRSARPSSTAGDSACVGSRRTASASSGSGYVSIVRVLCICILECRTAAGNTRVRAVNGTSLTTVTSYTETPAETRTLQSVDPLQSWPPSAWALAALPASVARDEISGLFLIMTGVPLNSRSPEAQCDGIRGGGSQACN